jgi:hypothetical protein
MMIQEIKTQKMLRKAKTKVGTFYRLTMRTRMNGQQTYSSYITNAGEHNRLRTQRSNQTWPKMLLPKHYHAPEPSRTSDEYHQYGGLTGELPLFLALIAFSVDANMFTGPFKPASKTELEDS